MIILDYSGLLTIHMQKLVAKLVNKQVDWMHVVQYALEIVPGAP